MTRQHTSDLKQQVERILLWEKSSHWRTRDFVHLSELISRHTHRPIDAAELQDFWKLSTIPSKAFMDTLAQYADYDDWDDFCNRNFYGVVEVDEETSTLHARTWEIPIKWVIAICWFSIIASVVIGILLVWKH